MGKNPLEPVRVLAVAPTTKGLGYVVLEDGKLLVEWKARTAAKDKNAKCLTILEEILIEFHPSALVLENVSVSGSRRSRRIKSLSKRMIDLAKRKKVTVSLLTKAELKETLFEGGTPTKHDIAEAMSQQFPDELGELLPPKRKLWQSENPRISVFEAMALAFVFFQKKEAQVSRIKS